MMIYILQGGELAADIADLMKSKLPEATVVSMDDSKTLKEIVSSSTPATLVIFLVQTVENGQPPDAAGGGIRFFKRKTHSETMLEGKFQFTCLGLGDSNLLLDRQTTTAKDCNQVAQHLDSRLQALGGSRYYPLGLADERSGLTEVEPWVEGLVASLTRGKD